MPASPAALRNRLKLRQLVLLAELDVSGSLHKAAERLGMSQPAATRLVHELEELLGASLFERTSKGMSATDMGRLLMRHASTVLAAIDHMHDEAAALRSGSSGTLRIGLSHGALPQTVAQAVVQLKRETPRMEITLIQGASEMLLDGLREGSLDAMVGRAPAGPGREVLDFELLYAEHFAVVCAASHPLSGRACDFADLIDRPWILPSSGTALRSNLELLFLSQCGRTPGDFIEATSPPLINLLVIEGDRLAVVPGWLARDLAAGGRMRVLVDRIAHLSGPIGLTRRKGEVDSTQVQRFAKALRHACEALLPHAGDPKTGSRSPNT